MPGWLCPPWLGYLLASPVRRLVHKPERILAGLVAPGMTALDVGPGMGFFALPMARMVGASGRVICVDVQEAMLRSLRRRAEAARLGDRIITRLCSAASLGLADLAGTVDFVLAFAVVHEMPDVPNFFAQIAQVTKPGARCLIAEPKEHVSAQGFEETLKVARGKGFNIVDRPRISGSHAALLAHQD
jgi:ubiquinone/menaquinone biosynthesis C-methylase UbiE